jgi:iron complex transport system substrate-binding protein
VLANLPSVKNGQVFGLGIYSFRIDYYSGKEIVDGIVSKFGN